VLCHSHRLFFQFYPRFTRFECKLFLHGAAQYDDGTCEHCMVDNSGLLHQAAESVMVGHPVFITAGVLDNPELTWPKRFIGDDKPLGRVLRTSADVIDFARAS
jgi:hypothetical protein